MKRFLMSTVFVTSILFATAVFAQTSACWEEVEVPGKLGRFSPGWGCLGNKGVCYTKIVWVEDEMYACNCTVAPRTFPGAGFYLPDEHSGYAYVDLTVFQQSADEQVVTYTLGSTSVPVNSLQELESKYPGVVH